MEATFVQEARFARAGPCKSASLNLRKALNVTATLRMHVVLCVVHILFHFFFLLLKLNAIVKLYVHFCNFDIDVKFMDCTGKWEHSK